MLSRAKHPGSCRLRSQTLGFVARPRFAQNDPGRRVRRRLCHLRRRGFFLVLFSLAGVSLLRSVPPAASAPEIEPQPGYSDVVQSLRPLIQHELDEKRIPSIAVALVDDQKVVWAQGFGLADPDRKLPATAETVYRVGSVSKL